MYEASHIRQVAASSELLRPGDMQTVDEAQCVQHGALGAQLVLTLCTPAHAPLCLVSVLPSPLYLQTLDRSLCVMHVEYFWASPVLDCLKHFQRASSNSLLRGCIRARAAPHACRWPSPGQTGRVATTCTMAETPGTSIVATH